MPPRRARSTCKLRCRGLRFPRRAKKRFRQKPQLKPSCRECNEYTQLAGTMSRIAARIGINRMPREVQSLRGNIGKVEIDADAD
jgi:hypothetical protein